MCTSTNGSPIAKEALDMIGALFDIERPIAGHLPNVRQQVRAELAKPKLEALASWLDLAAQAHSRTQRPRRCHPLCALSLGRADTLHRRWPVRDL